MTSASAPQQITGPQRYAVGSPIGSTTVTESEGITVGDVMRILKQRKLSIILTWILLYALVVIATLLIRRFAPAYTSEALFELQDNRSGDEDALVQPRQKVEDVSLVKVLKRRGVADDLTHWRRRSPAPPNPD